MTFEPEITEGQQIDVSCPSFSRLSALRIRGERLKRPSETPATAASIWFTSSAGGMFAMVRQAVSLFEVGDWNSGQASSPLAQWT